MEEDRRENSSYEEDDMQEKDSEAELSESESEVPDSKTNILETSTSVGQISSEDLRRRPLHPEKKRIGIKTDEHCSNFNKNKGSAAQSRPIATLGSSATRFVIPLLCVMIVILYVLFPGEQLNVEKLMSDLKSRFGDQPLSTFRVIGSALKKASSDNSSSPGIIVLISSRESKETTLELAYIIVQAVSKPHDSVVIQSRSSSSAHQLKMEIDDTIRGNLTKGQMRAVLVRDLDRLPFEAALIFHGYCDDGNAPFKKAAYVMTAVVDEAIPPNSEILYWDILATKHLKAVWSNSGEDQVASLISRLTGNVAAVVSKG